MIHFILNYFHDKKSASIHVCNIASCCNIVLESSFSIQEKHQFLILKCTKSFQSKLKIIQFLFFLIYSYFCVFFNSFLYFSWKSQSMLFRLKKCLICNFYLFIISKEYVQQNKWISKRCHAFRILNNIISNKNIYLYII